MQSSAQNTSGESTNVARSRASGEIGRRAGFRCLYSKGCGGSSPPSPTIEIPATHDVYVVRIAISSAPLVTDRSVMRTVTRPVRYRATDAARRAANAGSPFAYPVETTVSLLVKDFAKVAIATTDSLLSELTPAPKLMVSELVRSALLSNRIMVGFDETLGVEPLASRVAVTMHVPTLLTVSASPLIAQPFAVPFFTRKLSVPPWGSPLTTRVSDDPSWPVREATVNTGTGITGNVDVVVVVVVVVDVGVVCGGGGGGGGGEEVVPVPVSVTV